MFFLDDLDNYYEPDEASLLMAEYVEKMTATLKESARRELDRVVRENNTMKSELEHLHKTVAELRRKIKALSQTEADAIRKAKRMKASELLDEIKAFVWMAKHTYEMGEKCDNCSAGRKIEFTSPSGKRLTEDCACATRSSCYVPIKKQLYKLSVREGEVLAISYKESSSDGDAEFFEARPQQWPPPGNYEGVNEYNAMFLSLEECQEFCDYLNRIKI